ncbi:MAG: hypothetical protein ABI972_14685 [Acidobacteriota bacterium]
MTLRLLVLFVAALCPALEIETAGSARMEFVVENGAQANLVYHAVCIAEKISCTSASFQQLWKQKLAWSTNDERLMQAFRKAIGFSGSPVAGTYPFLPNYPAFYGDERKERALIAALLDARDLDDAVQRAKTLAGRKRASAVSAMLTAMKPRFDRWWSDEGDRRSQGYAHRITKTLRDHKLVELSQTVAHLMGFEWQGMQRLRFHIISHPDADPHSVRATQIQQQAVLEATTILSTEKYVSISLHELFHYFYDSLPLDRHVALMRQFAASDEKFAGAYYTLFNEALVSAAATLVDQRLMPETFRKESTNLNYFHPCIAPLARALFTIVPGRIQRNEPFLDAIAPAYIAAGKLELGAAANKLAFAMMARGVYGNDALIKRMSKPLQESSPAIGTFTNEAKLLRHFEYVNVIRLAIRPGPSKVEQNEPTPKSVAVSFTAPDEAALDKLIRDFFAR